MTNWTALVAKMNKAEKDVSEWTEGLRDAEKTLSAARAEMAAALGMSKVANGTGHKAAPAPLLKVAPKKAKRVHRVTHDYKRKARILALLKEKGGFVTISDVATAERCTRDLAGGALWVLAKEGKLSRVAKGRYAAVTPAAKAA